MNMGNLCTGINHNNIVLSLEDEKLLTYKKAIISASQKNLCLCFQMNDGRQYVGKPRLYKNDNYNNLQDVISVEVILFRDIPLWYHVGGEKLQFYIRRIENIILMNEEEIEDSIKYTDYAPLFVKRLFPDI
jgi:hypothetical protein